MAKSDPETRRPRTGVVLSGGGARGAYEAGVIAGIVDILKMNEGQPSPFDVYTGTSVGAINAAWLAAHADRADMNIGGLLELWRGLHIGQHLKLSPLRFLAGPRLARWRGEKQERWGRSLLNPRALERLVEENIPYEKLHENVEAGHVRALVIAALEVSTARTTMFAELAPGVVFNPSKDPRRISRDTHITARHVLASAALPLLFPARRIGTHYYADGGIRFNTPISPAIRAGADRLVVISVLFPEASHAADGSLEAKSNVSAYPSPLFLIGKVLDALLLDPVGYDLQVLERFNALIGTLEQTLEVHEMERFQTVMKETRGQAYRQLETLVFRPSQDIGHMAHQYAARTKIRSLSTLTVQQLARRGNFAESDLLSFVLFDGAFTGALLDLGRKDAVARADEVRAFFADDS